MDVSLEWKIVGGGRRFTRGHRTIGGEKEIRNNYGEPTDRLNEKQKHGSRYDRG